MSKPFLDSKKSSVRLPACLLLAGLGFLGNWHKMELFFNVDFLPGSIFVMLAVLLLGEAYGVIAGFVAATCTYFLWLHPWAIVIMTGEALFVARVYSKRKGNVVVYDMLYWLLIGMPLVFVFYHHVMAIQMQSTLLIMLKQSMNGIFNALLASGIHLLTHIRKDSTREGVPFSQLIFTVMCSLVLIPTMFFLAIGMRLYLQKEKAALAARVDYACEIARESLTNWLNEHHRVIQTLAVLVGDPERTASSEIQHYVETVKASAPAFFRMGALNKDSVTVAYSPLEVDGKSTVGVDFSDRPYILIMKEHKQPYIPDVVMGKLGNPIPIALLLAPLVVDGEYKGYATGVIDVSHLSKVMGTLTGKDNLNITLVDGKWRVIAGTVSNLRLMDEFMRPYTQDGEIETEESFHWIPQPHPGTSIMQRWRDSLLIKAIPLGPTNNWRVIVEAPILPLVEHISRFSVYGLSLLGLLTVLTVFLSELISRRFVHSIVGLQDITRLMPDRIADIPLIVWPTSRIGELATLTKNFRDMALALDTSFRQQEALNATLEKKVKSRTEALLKANEMLTSQAQLLDLAEDAIMVQDRDNQIVYWNQGAERTYGWEAQEAVGKVIRELLCTQSARPLNEVMAQVLESGRWEGELQHKTRFGDWIHVTSRWVLQKDAEGNSRRMLVINRDITSRVRMEKELMESKERLSLALQGADLGMWDWDMVGGSLEFNERYAEMAGYSKDDVGYRADWWGELIHPDDKPLLKQNMSSHIEGESPAFETELRVLNKSGKWMWVLDKGKATHWDELGRPLRMVGTRLDITVRKETEDRIVSQRDLAVLLSSTGDLLVALRAVLDEVLKCENIDCGGIYVLDSHTGSLDLAVHEGLSDAFLERVRHFEADSERVQLVLQGKPLYKVYREMLLELGEVQHEGEELRALAIIPIISRNLLVAVVNAGSYSQDEIPIRARNVMEAIASQTGSTLARIRAEEKLRESRENFQTLFDTVNDFLFIVDRAGRLIDCNSLVKRRMGYSPEELAGMNVNTLHPVEKRGEVVQIFGEMLQGQRGLCDIPLITKDGIIIPVETKVVQGRWSEQEAIFGVSRDISERLAAQEQRLIREQETHQVEKAKSLSRMAAAIAHHFNNKLAGVMGYIDLALDDLGSNPKAADCIKEARRSCEQAADMSRLMLAYLGLLPSRVELLDLGRTCRERLNKQVTGAQEQITLQVDTPPHGSLIRANCAQVHQVLDNLVVNAREAIGEGEGRIRVSVRVISAAETASPHRFPVQWQPEADAYACLEVSDTGCGISPEHLALIFDPFFSDKFTGRGLGLAVVLGVIRAYGGAIAVETQPGRGSTFRVFWPLETREAMPTEKVCAAVSRTISAPGSVLFVDDELQLRNMAQRMIGHMGCKVATAENGFEAVDIFRKLGREISLVILDLTMPGMDGWQTLLELKALDPDIPVILSSGYDEAQAMDSDHSKLIAAFLPKPYAYKDLKATIGMAIGGASQ